MINVNSLSEFNRLSAVNEKSLLLVYKKGTGVSDCAYRTLTSLSNSGCKIAMYVADAQVAKDVHPAFGVTSAPSLLILEKGKVKDVVKGCHDESFYKNLLQNVTTGSTSKGNQQKAVTVYSTPTCPWCNTLKSFLRQHGIAFSDIDVSRDPDAARRMVQATGQQGVPQANIGGDWVVGFDQLKIKRLLNITNS